MQLNRKIDPSPPKNKINKMTYLDEKISDNINQFMKKYSISIRYFKTISTVTLGNKKRLDKELIGIREHFL